MGARPHDLDVVVFLEDIDGWPAGTSAVVIAEEPGGALVEVMTEHLVDSEGFPLRDLFEDLVHVDDDQLRVVDAYGSRAG
jgi:hypothetical protein